MIMLRAVLAAGAVLIGAIAAFLGGILVISAVTSGTIDFTYASDGKMVSESVSRAGDAARFWKLVFGLGVLPAGLGLISARWGWRSIKNRG